MSKEYNEDGIRLIQGDCLEVMDKLIKEGVKVDAIICDPPYGTTACKWDTIIPFDEMWQRLKLLKRDDRTPTVLFGSEPFSSHLRLSNMKEYKYDWKWDKIRGVGHLNAKKRPMMCVEDILVFYKKQSLYCPQMRNRDKNRKSKNKTQSNVYGKTQSVYVGEVLDKKYPINLVSYSKSNSIINNYHPTQNQ